VEKVNRGRSERLKAVFDLRYHVASLAAVFIALVVGILIGVGISGRGFVDDAERDRLNGEIAELRAELDLADERTGDLERRQEAAQKFVEAAYPVLVETRLTGKRVAVLVVGSFDSTLEAVTEIVGEESGGRPVRVRAVRVPLSVDEVERILASSDAFGGYVGEDELGNLGRDLGRELVSGGETPLWDALAPELVEQRAFESTEEADAVVVVRSVEPQQRETARFLAGLYSGVASLGKPAVGVEPSRVAQSAIPTFQRHSLSTVDGIDEPVGRLALVLLLAGARGGDYGVRDTADDGILPPIEPAPRG
jgi:Copper transport outer membrane protein, MctB